MPLILFAAWLALLPGASPAAAALAPGESARPAAPVDSIRSASLDLPLAPAAGQLPSTVAPAIPVETAEPSTRADLPADESASGSDVAARALGPVGPAGPASVAVGEARTPAGRKDLMTAANRTGSALLGSIRNPVEETAGGTSGRAAALKPSVKRRDTKAFLNLSRVALKWLPAAPTVSASMRNIRFAKALAKLVALIDRATFHQIETLRAFGRDVATEHMDPRFVGFHRPDMTADEALADLHELIRGEKMDDIPESYLVDAENHLLGVVRYNDLLSADKKTTISELAREPRLVIKPGMSQHLLEKAFGDRDALKAPVVDSENRVVGVLSSVDVIKSGNTLAYSPLRIAVASTPFLFITNLLEAFVVSGIVLHYTSMLPDGLNGHLAAFTGVIAATGGNAGSQRATSIVQGIVGHFFERNGGKKKVIMNQILGGMILGVGFGALMMGIVLYNGLGFGLAALVGGGMFVSVTIGSIMGVYEPFILRRFGFDPASGTGPLISTAADILSNWFYYGGAVWMALHGFL